MDVCDATDVWMGNTDEDELPYIEIEDDGYDPTKPEYCIAIPAEEIERRRLELQCKQSIQLEKAARNRCDQDSDVTQFYYNLVEEWTGEEKQACTAASRLILPGTPTGDARRIMSPSLGQRGRGRQQSAHPCAERRAKSRTPRFLQANCRQAVSGISGASAGGIFGGVHGITLGLTFGMGA